MQEESGYRTTARGKLLRSRSLVTPEVKNPFYHKIHLKWWDKLQILLMSITILPLRVLSFMLLLFMAMIIAAFCVCGQDYNQKQPFTGWRKSAHPIMRFLHRASFFCIGFHSIRVIGRRDENVSILVCAPHTSYFDTFVACVTNLPSGVSRIENIKVPLLGVLVRYVQPVLVSREDPNSRQTTIREIRRRAGASVTEEPSAGTETSTSTPELATADGKADKWPQIVIFPEGTCSNGACLISFKPGAFIPGVPVQPVCIRYRNKLNTCIWTWDGESALKLFWLTLCQLQTSVEVEFLDVYHPSERERSDYKLYARNVRDVMARALGVPVTDHTFEDCRLMKAASRQNLPLDAGIIEFYKLSSKLGITWKNVEERLQTFSKIAHTNSGLISVDDFARYLHVPASDSLREMFNLYDRDGSGKIDFREYVIGVSLLAETANTEETIKFAFDLFDADGKGHISKPDLYKILSGAFDMLPSEVDALFVDVDAGSRGYITYDDFLRYARRKPEYARLFTIYHSRKQQQQQAPCSVGVGGEVSGGEAPVAVHAAREGEVRRRAGQNNQSDATATATAVTA